MESGTYDEDVFRNPVVFGEPEPMFTPEMISEYLADERAERIAEADSGRMARVIEPPHVVARIIRPETCAHFWLYSRTRCVWCGTFEQDVKAGYS